MTALRETQGHDWTSVAIGDSVDDYDMLAAADIAYLVQGENGRWRDMDLPHLRKIPAVGPLGWNPAALEMLR